MPIDETREFVKEINTKYYCNLLGISILPPHPHHAHAHTRIMRRYSASVGTDYRIKAVLKFLSDFCSRHWHNVFGAAFLLYLITKTYIK